MFPSATYAERRQSLMMRLSGGLVLLPGNGESPRNYRDNGYTFRQDSTFLYYFGLNHPDLVGLLDVDQGMAMIFGDDLSMDAIVWMGAQPTVAERALQVGVTRVFPLDDLPGVLGQALADGRSIHHLPPYRAETALQLSHWLDVPPRELEEAASLELILAVAGQRNIKTAEEVAEIERAVDTTVDMHLAAMRMVAARPDRGPGGRGGAPGGPWRRGATSRSPSSPPSTGRPCTTTTTATPCAAGSCSCWTPGPRRPWAMPAT